MPMHSPVQKWPVISNDSLDHEQSILISWWYCWSSSSSSWPGIQTISYILVQRFLPSFPILFSCWLCVGVGGGTPGGALSPANSVLGSPALCQLGDVNASVTIGPKIVCQEFPLPRQESFLRHPLSPVTRQFGRGSRRRLSFASSSHDSVIYMCGVMLVILQLYIIIFCGR